MVRTMNTYRNEYLVEEIYQYKPEPFEIVPEDLPPDKYKSFRIGDIVVPIFVPVDDGAFTRQIKEKKPLTIRKISGPPEKRTIFFKNEKGYYLGCFFKKAL